MLSIKHFISLFIVIVFNKGDVRCSRDVEVNGIFGQVIRVEGLSNRFDSNDISYVEEGRCYHSTRKMKSLVSTILDVHGSN